METISHREMRNRSAEVLRRVAAGESVQVSNNGIPTALIVPVGGSGLDALIARGEARPARTASTSLAALEPVESPATTREIIDDVRGRW